MKSNLENIGLKWIHKNSRIFAILWKPVGNWAVEFVSENIDQYGYSQEDFSSGKMMYGDIIYPEDTDKINSALLECGENKDEQFLDLEYRIISKSGKLHWVAERSLLIRDNKGNIINIRGLVLDITEHKNAELELRISEEKYVTLVEKGNDGIIIVQDDTLKFVNSKICELMGYEREELLGGQVLDHVLVDYKRMISKRYNKTLNDKMNVRRNSEAEFLTKQGNRFPAEISFSYIHHEFKPAVVMTIRDISERKRAEIELKDSEKKYSTLVEKGDDMIVIVQNDSLAFSNPKFRSVTGYQKDEAIGKHFSEFFSKGYRKMIGERFRGDMAKNWTSPRKYEVELISKDNEKIAAELNSSIIEHEGKPAYMAIIRDIREQKERERELLELLEMQKLLVNVINNSPTVIFIWRPENDWPVEFVSENISQFGYSVEDFISGNILYGDLIHPSDIENVKAEVLRCNLAGIDFSYEYRIFTKSGEIRWVDERSIYKRDERGDVEYIQGIIVDITDRKNVNDFIRIEAEVGDFFSPAGDMKSVFEQMLEFTLQIDKIDCGALYLMDDLTGELSMVAHSGLSANFVKSTRYYDPKSINGKLFTTEYPIYKLYSEINALNKDEDLSYEDLKAMAIVPIKHNKKIVAVLFLASHSESEIPSDIRSSIETVSMQAGSIIGNIRDKPQVQKSTDISQYLIDSLEDLFFVIGMDGCILYTNQYFDDVMGYVKDELTGMSLLKLYPQNKALEAASVLADIMAGKKAISNIPMESYDGNTVLAETKFTRAKLNGKSVLVGLGRELINR
ncbi:PAS domain S-box protein [Methanococcoides seepicolus]|uniref:histidine kinase n=1 Tax=Methanococcoides seepicolus TaxID=2828780 RepID=A0A9E4ZGR3_9EURY|nr:PAS domain S-box protein [Methanococcoides seepicolus]MCM1987350.1 PAS domain S-box protein [Methanococcoides seepicolus]